MITIKDFIDNIEKNGYPQAFGSYISRNINTNEVEGACAMGQAILNLGYYNQYEFFNKYNLPVGMMNRIMNLNDNEHKDLPTIVKYLRDYYAHRLNEPLQKVY